MSLVIKSGFGCGEEAVGSGMVVVAWDGVKAEGGAVNDSIDWGDEDCRVPAGAGL